MAAEEHLDERQKLLAEMRAYRKKINGGVEVTADDPLATQKIKVARYLKKFGLSESELPAGFWDEPDEADRGRLLGEVVGPVMAQKRFAKRVERMIKRGYPRDYYERPEHERRLISNQVRSRRWRAKQPASRKAESMRKTELPAATVTREWIADKFSRLKKWNIGPDPRARQWHGREREFVNAAAAYYRLRRRSGRAPSLGELATEIGCTRSAAQNRMRVLTALFAVGGPWHRNR